MIEHKEPQPCPGEALQLGARAAVNAGQQAAPTSAWQGASAILGTGSGNHPAGPALLSARPWTWMSVWPWMQSQNSEQMEFSSCRCPGQW